MSAFSEGCTYANFSCTGIKVTIKMVALCSNSSKQKNVGHDWKSNGMESWAQGVSELAALERAEHVRAVARE